MFVYNRYGVEGFDLNRYLGVWYEIARYNHLFERGLVGVKAIYTQRTDGRISVCNEGRKWRLDGKRKQIEGVAKMGGEPSKGFLKVSFFPLIYAPYYVLALDTDRYDAVLVGSRSAKFLWVLARTPSLPTDRLDELLRFAQLLGYDISSLLYVPQT